MFIFFNKCNIINLRDNILVGDIVSIEYKKLETCDYDFVSRIIEENLSEVITQSFNGYFNNVLFFDRAMETGSSYIIYSNENPCGFIWYSLKGMRLHINTIIIDKNYQGNGIGSSIFRELEIKAKESKIPFLQLGVQGVNKRARNLYKRLGFKDIGYMREFDTYYMEKKIL